MKVYIASDNDGLRLKNVLIDKIKEMKLDYKDLTKEGFDLVDASNAVCENLLNDNSYDSVGIVIDRFGAGSYIACNKHKHIVAAEISDERSAIMTKRHNGARVLVMGSGIVGDDLAISCMEKFLTYKYDGGRHQIRIDMLDKML
ncbi:MAG: RpiB/LacA/LacB family sugar-phosphate isomerase [Tissierellia bacterium]|nr:RpiB/LacA/LacB family sugar-phosphate isomerase [Tissierellia bacterium]